MIYQLHEGNGKEMSRGMLVKFLIESLIGRHAPDICNSVCIELCYNFCCKMFGTECNDLDFDFIYYCLVGLYQ